MGRVGWERSRTGLKGSCDVEDARTVRRPRAFHVRQAGLAHVEAALQVDPKHGGQPVRSELLRTHQSRVHARHIGHPLLGDATYHGAKSCRGPQNARRQKLYAGLFGETLTRPALHAASLALAHPRTGETSLTRSPLPDDMVAAIEALGGDPAAVDAALMEGVEGHGGM